MNKSLIKDNAKSFVDSEERSSNFMRCAPCPLALSCCYIQAAAFIYTNTFAQQNLSSRCHHDCISAFTHSIHTLMVPHVHLHIHSSAFTLHFCSSIDAAACMLQLSHCSIFLLLARLSIGAASLTLLQLGITFHSAAFWSQHSLSSDPGLAVWHCTLSLY